MAKRKPTASENKSSHDNDNDKKDSPVTRKETRAARKTKFKYVLNSYDSNALHKSFATKGYTLTAKTKELAEKIVNLPVSPPSIELLNAIHLLGYNRCYDIPRDEQRKPPQRSSDFCQSSLFALGVVMNEWAKQLAKDAALKADKPCENE